MSRRQGGKGPSRPAAPRKKPAAAPRKGNRPAWTEKPGASRPRKRDDEPEDKPAPRRGGKPTGKPAPRRADKPAAAPRRGSKSPDPPAWVEKKTRKTDWEERPASRRGNRKDEEKPAPRRGSKSPDPPAWVDKKTRKDEWEERPAARRGARKDEEKPARKGSKKPEPPAWAEKPARGRGRAAAESEPSGQSAEQRHDAAARRVHARRDQEQARSVKGRFTRDDGPAWEERPPRESARGWEQRGDADDIVYGRRPVLETLRAGRSLNRLYVLAGAGNVPSEIFHLARERDIPLVHADKERLERLSRGGNHQGVVAQVAARDFASLDELMSKSAGPHALILALDGVQDPHNLGALLRTAEAAGVTGVLLTARGSVGLTGAVSRSSAGADQHLTIARTDKLDRILKDCARDGFVVVGADMKGGQSLFGGANLTGRTILVLGAEGEGLSPKVLEVCTHRLRLPMLGQIESLNVSVSGALFLYEAVRQRELNKVQHSS